MLVDVAVCCVEFLHLRFSTHPRCPFHHTGAALHSGAQLRMPHAKKKKTMPPVQQQHMQQMTAVQQADSKRRNVQALELLEHIKPSIGPYLRFPQGFETVSIS